MEMHTSIKFFLRCIKCLFMTIRRDVVSKDCYGGYKIYIFFQIHQGIDPSKDDAN